MKRIIVTADKHGVFDIVERYIKNRLPDASREDLVVILGDSGLNYYLDERDVRLKEKLAKLPVTFLILYGNHEERPANLPWMYDEVSFYGGTAYTEKRFPNLVFAGDGEVYSICGKKILCIGGAFSPDKEYRLRNGLPYFPDEEIGVDIQRHTTETLERYKWDVDYVFTHTTPYEDMPTDMFLPGFDQSKISHTSEWFLTEVKKNLKFHKWLAGHYHTDRIVNDKLVLLFDGFYELV